MQTLRIRVADGVELTVDTWLPTVGAAGLTSDAGEPPAFVLVHGLASNARLWDGVAERLASGGHPVAALDLRGHGRSSKPDGPYDVPTVADDVATAIAALRLDRPIVAGQSWGGNVAVELAARRPELTRGIVCVDGGWLEPSRSYADWPSCRAALAPPRLVGRPLAEIEAYVRSAHPDWPESGIRGTLANFEVRPDGTVAPWLTYERHVVVLRGLWDHHPSERWADVSVPVLLVPVDGGGHDRDDRRRRDVAAALEAIPDGRVRWFTGDHDIHAQHPGELASAMREFATDGISR